MSVQIKCDKCEAVSSKTYSFSLTESTDFIKVSLSTQGRYPTVRIEKDLCPNCAREYGLDLTTDPTPPTNQELLWDILQDLASEAVDEAMQK